MRFKDTSSPVTVIKSYHHGSLGIARSLGRLGVGVYGVDSNPKALGLHSRYFKGKYLCNLDNASPKETIQYLLEVADKIGKPSLLIPTYDECVVAIAKYADNLKGKFFFPCLTLQLIQALTSKKDMYFLSKKHDVPTAEAFFPQSTDDLEKYLQYAVFPIMLKGIHGKATERRCGSKMFIAKNKSELLSLYNRFEDPLNRNFMLQEYIPGGEDSIWMFNGYFNKKSECLFSVTGRKMRQTPPYTGMTSLGICLRNDVVDETSTRFMHDVGYQGIVDIGYRFDSRDGKYKVLDINPRIGCTFRLFVADNGLDVARAEYLDLTGQEVPSSRPVENRKWLIEDSDFFSSIQYYLDKKLTIRQWANSLRGVNETAWFARDDPLPFFNMCAQSSFSAIRQAGRLTGSNNHH
jgi:D-aspartate ligase